MTTPHYREGEHVPGTVYRVVRKLGSAGFGAVYEVEDTTVGRRYCLKTLTSVVGDIDAFRERLALEAQTLARLAHPNIVQVVTAGVTEGDQLPFFVMELLHGRTLRDTLASRGQLEVAHAIEIATEILDALEHAHGRGVIHRDVKPENIFLHRAVEGGPVHAKLLDFGIVGFSRDLPGLEQPEGYSPRYAAPELVEGKAATEATDLYGMGLVLYEMLSGRGPFDDAGDMADVARARLERGPRPLQVNVPIVLEDVILSALERDPALRPTDAFTFAETLRIIAGKVVRVPQQGLLSSAPPPSLPSVPDIPAALVQADWRPPKAPKAEEVKGEKSDRPRRPRAPAAADSESESESGRMSSRRYSLHTALDSVAPPARDTLLGVAVGLALLLVTLVIVMMK